MWAERVCEIHRVISERHTGHTEASAFHSLTPGLFISLKASIPWLVSPNEAVKHGWRMAVFARAPSVCRKSPGEGESDTRWRRIAVIAHVFVRSDCVEFDFHPSPSIPPSLPKVPYIRSPPNTQTRAMLFHIHVSPSFHWFLFACVSKPSSVPPYSFSLFIPSHFPS